MGFIGQFTRNETVRLWADFVDLGGSPIEPTNVTVELRQGAVQLLAPSAMTQLGVGSNIFYRDYTVADAPVEGDVFVIYQGEVDGEVKEGSDFFKIDLMKTRVMENRLGNQRIRFFPATSANATRNTVVGVLDYQIIETKYDDDADWTTPRSSHTLWFWYGMAGDLNPIKVGESD